MTGLAGKVALVTGGAGGLGAVLAAALRARGATVVAAGRHTQPSLDVRSEPSVRAAFAAVQEAHGRLDVLVHAAGAGAFGPLESLSLDDWTRTLETNLTGAFLCSREAMGLMRRGGGGRMLFLGSAAGRRGLSGMAAYGASKFGLRGLAQVINEEGASARVQACLLTLGAVRVGLGRAVPGLDVSRMLDPDEVASAAMDLLAQPLSLRLDELVLLPETGVL